MSRPVDVVTNLETHGCCDSERVKAPQRESPKSQLSKRFLCRNAHTRAHGNQSSKYVLLENERDVRGAVLFDDALEFLRVGTLPDRLALGAGGMLDDHRPTDLTGQKRDVNGRFAHDTLGHRHSYTRNSCRG